MFLIIVHQVIKGSTAVAPRPHGDNNLLVGAICTVSKIPGIFVDPNLVNDNFLALIEFDATIF